MYGSFVNGVNKIVFEETILVFCVSLFLSFFLPVILR